MRLAFAACLLVVAATLSAQNLIPNPGFEDLKKCPKGLGQIDRASGWSSPNKGTPDYFNSCYTKDFETAGVPNNFFGTRNPQEGRGYAGILWGKQEKEYLQVALVEPLVEGRQYCLRFRAAVPSANSDGRAALRACFADAPMADPTWDALKVEEPSRCMSGDWDYAQDLDSWATYSKTYTAHGGETTLIVGYFGTLPDRAYTYLDAFELYESATFKGCASGAFVADDDTFNLVPNAGFEQYYECPTRREDLAKAVAWRVAENSPDFYHLCGTGTAAVPKNELGTQNPHAGNGYGGIWAMLQERENYREFVKTRLKKPLEAGREYCLSIWVSLAEDSDHALDELQLRITQPDDNSNCQVGVDTTELVTLRNGRLLDDRTGWVFLHGTFKAKGGEQSIMIGNFRGNDDPHMRKLGVLARKGFQFSNCCYYYIDDVGLHAVGSPTCVCPGPGTDLVVQEPAPKEPAPTPKPTLQSLPTLASGDFKAGDTLVMHNLHFAFDKADLLPASYPQLDSLSDFLQHHPDFRIRISGHTDSDGEVEYNRQLSENRAASVRAYLQAHGIAPDRMQSRGAGEQQPVASNADEAGKALNRRVEVEFLQE